MHIDLNVNLEIFFCDSLIHCDISITFQYILCESIYYYKPFLTGNNINPYILTKHVPRIKIKKKNFENQPRNKKVERLISSFCLSWASFTGNNIKPLFWPNMCQGSKWKKKNFGNWPRIIKVETVIFPLFAPPDIPLPEPTLNPLFRPDMC